MPLINKLVSGSVASGGGGGTGDMEKATYDPNDDGIIAVANGGTDSSTASGARTNLGLGTIATQDSSNVSITGGSITGITDLAVADGGTGASTASDARTNLGAQAQDADLDAISALSSNGLLSRTGAGAYATRTLTAGSANLSVTNGDGVSGNPTIDVGANVALLTGTQTLSGDKTFSGALNVDTISERTAANGVTIDGVKALDSFIELSEIASPSNPASDKGRLFAKDSAGVTKAYFRDSAGTESALGVTGGNIFPIFYSSSLGKMDVSASSYDGFGVFGTAAFSLAAVAGYSISSAIDSFGRRARMTTGSTSGNYVGYYNASGAFTRLEHLPYLYFTMAIPTITSTRVFAGLSSVLTGGTITGSDNPAASMIGVQFSTARGDTELMAVANDAGSPLTATSTGWTVVAGTVIQVFIDVQSTSSVKIYIFDTGGTQLGSTVTLTTDLPTSTTNMGLIFGVETQTSSGRNLDVYTASYRNNAYGLTSFPG